MTQTHDHSSRTRMLDLCKRALAAELSFEELMAAYPRGAPGGEYPDLFYEDLVDAVEHVPATLSGKLDAAAWKGSEMYAGLLLHSSLLQSNLEEVDRVRLYRHVRSKHPLAVEGVDVLVLQARLDLRDDACLNS